MRNNLYITDRKHRAKLEALFIVLSSNEQPRLWRRPKSKNRPRGDTMRIWDYTNVSTQLFQGELWYRCPKQWLPTIASILHIRIYGQDRQSVSMAGLAK